MNKTGPPPSTITPSAIARLSGSSRVARRRLFGFGSGISSQIALGSVMTHCLSGSMRGFDTEELLVHALALQVRHRLVVCICVE